MGDLDDGGLLGNEGGIVLRGELRQLAGLDRDRGRILLRDRGASSTDRGRDGPGDPGQSLGRRDELIRGYAQLEADGSRATTPGLARRQAADLADTDARHLMDRTKRRVFDRVEIVRDAVAERYADRRRRSG